MTPFCCASCVGGNGGANLGPLHVPHIDTATGPVPALVPEFSSALVLRGVSAKIGEDGQYPPMTIVLSRDAELHEQIPGVALDGALCEDESRRYPRVRETLRHQREDLMLARRQLTEHPI